VGIDVETEITIARPREEVAAFACEPDNATAWYANIESAEWRTPRPLALGSRFAFVARFLGRRLAYVYEVKELVDGERMVMATADGPFDMETTYTFADAGDGATLMSLRNRGGPSRFAAVAAVAARRANRRDLARLKRILEDAGPGQAAATSPRW
jgi:Polyketide cyclase / dehydrase and lipid transport